MIRVSTALFCAAAALAATPAAAQDASTGGAREGRAVYVSPYVELSQTLLADLSNDDTLTYTQLAAGVDAGIATRRAQGQVSYRYERRFAWNDDLASDSVHSGLLRGAYKLTRDLTIEGGALATRARSDIRGAAPGTFGGDLPNVTQVYSAYIGPTLSTRYGPVEIGAAYRFGYTKVEVPNVPGLAPGLPRLDYYDDSTGHVAQVSAGVAAGAVLPVGVTLSAAWDREDASQLDQRYEGKYVRGDVLYPVSRTLAVRGGVGYEKIEASQRDALVDAIGTPVTDGNGRFVTDPTSPRRIAYNTDGLIYDAGVVWRPNRRFELQANAGYRYGGEIYTGSLTYQMTRDMGLQVVVYDGIETFGRQLRDGLRSLPTSFMTGLNPFGGQFGGCVFGANPGAAASSGGGAGGCLNDAFQSISTSSYRARGVDAVWAVTRGPQSFGVGAGYTNRRLYAPRTAPGLTVFGVEDEGYYGQVFYARQLDRVSSFDTNVYANYFESGLAGYNGNGTLGAGANAAYSRSFGRLGTIAALGLYSYDQQGYDSDLSLQALLGARYQF